MKNETTDLDKLEAEISNVNKNMGSFNANELVNEIRAKRHEDQWQAERERLGITLVPRLLIGFMITPIFIFAVMSVILFFVDPGQKIIGAPR